ncbi:hypothetical protein PRUPE_6G254400 [Prunus persica]|uniref:Cyclic nucleotide-binding domain-containing protein n=1 Tax=Prunus persica TaxID=3760 RepID=A0A251NX90_PRUPE|nr:hypothetical protein PRUPE_6G254400 [Prunus persica]
MKSHLTLKNLSYMGRIIRDMLGTRCIRDMLGTRCIRRMFGIPYVRREEVWSMTMGILAALPVPQMAILVFFPTLRASRAVNRMRIMNSLILLQYVPRIYPIYRHCKDLNKNKLDNCISDQIERKTWVPGLLNFILYILASYVFGTFWYFFSIQRQVECWGHACQSGNGCEFRIFDCDDDVTLRNVTLLNDLCPINPSNAKVFDFGIYLDALQSGMLGSTDFPRKVLQCFSWGVRNLSSFGSNLRTSMNAWETLFVVSICISGLLLFIYLLGHLQVPTLQGIDENVLADIFLDHLEQVIYDGGNYIIREGEPLDMMIFISRGSVLTYNTSSTGHVGGGSGLSNTIGRLTGGDFYGQELISWATTSTSFSDLPISSKTLKSLEKVEVFAIRASVLLHIVSKHKEYFKTETQHPHPTDSNLIEINEHGNLKLLHMQYCARSGTHLLASYL